ncbi:MAG: maltose acetyltransferase domain-containing protein [Lachnospiraceae bacterium]
MTTREKMKQGRLYTDMCEGLEQERLSCKELLYDFNHSRPSKVKEREALLHKILGHAGDGLWIEPPLRMAYGTNTHIGKDTYINFNLTVVDDGEVWIGDHVMIAPNVTITATGHPITPKLREKGMQYSVPVKIGNNVWIGSGAVILQGITIGDNSVIGAGSIVTKDVPKNVVAVGNPCHVLREINERDKEFYDKDKQIQEEDWH